MAGRCKVRIPARSVRIIKATGIRNSSVWLGNQTVLLEPLRGPSVMNNLFIVNTLIEATDGVLYVHVVNLGDDDIWLPPKTRLACIHDVSFRKRLSACEEVVISKGCQHVKK